MRKIIKYGISILVVIILLLGIVSIFKRLTGHPVDAGSNHKVQNKAEEITTEAKKDNSIPITSLTIEAPAGFMRVGDTMQLNIKYEPADATNPELVYTCSGGSSDHLVDVDENGILSPTPDSGKNTVTVTATTTDGSDISVSFPLRIYEAIDPSKPMVAITFDDGPYPDTTNPMLDALEENYARATFFCLGKNATYYPDTVMREFELGMEVATHTNSHLQLTTLSASALDNEISAAVKALEDITGVAPTLMRPPYGAQNSTVLAAVKQYGLCCMNWSLDTEDWKTKNADATYNEVMKAEDGDVVLLHDIHEYNVNAVERFVPDLIARGFQLVTVPELYYYRGETLDPGTVHYRTDPTTEASPATAPVSASDAAMSTEARQ